MEGNPFGKKNGNLPGWSNGPERLAANSAKEEATLTSGPRMSTMRMAGTSPKGGPSCW